MLEILKWVFDKVLSARWFIVVALTTAYVWCTVMSINIDDKFLTIYGMIVVFYFSRSDRKTENKQEVK